MAEKKPYSVSPTPPTPYAKAYPKIPVDVLRREIIPRAADECAKKRLPAAQYRACLKQTIARMIREWRPPE